MIEHRCNLCGHTRGEIQHAIKRFRTVFYIAKCVHCGLLYQYPEVKDSDAMYNEGYYKGTNEYSYIDEREDKFIRDLENQRRIRNFESFFPKPRSLKILDIGCSFGNLVQNANKLGHEGVGMEVSEWVVNLSRLECAGIDLVHGDICDMTLAPERFDVVCMAETIEHLRDPMSALRNCRAMMKNDGIILIQTTNMDSLTRKIEGKNSRYFLPGHLFYFSIKTLKRLLNETGFKIEKIYYGHETGLVPALVRKSLCNLGRFHWSDLRVFLYTVLMHMLSKLHIGTYSIHNGMVVIARKRRFNDKRTKFLPT